MTFPKSFQTAVNAFVIFVLALGSVATLNGQGAGPRGKAALLDPKALNEKAPDVFKANFDTSKGTFVIEVHRSWAPIGADHFYNLVKRGFYDGNRFFRVSPGYMVQWGLSGDPDVTKALRMAYILDDEWGKQSNKRGTIGFVGANLNRRATEVYVNMDDNVSLDMDQAPFGQVISGMEVFARLYSGYGDFAPVGKGPHRDRYYSEGNAYIEKDFPMMDYIKSATIIP